MNIQSMLKQAQKMQADLTKAEKELQEKEFIEENELIKVICDGKHHVKSIEIKEVDDKEILADMILLAINKNIDKANAENEEIMKKVTGGIKVPGVF